MDKVRTVSDTKRDFYNHHTRPINSVYRRFVEELMVEMHLLSVNADFRDDPIYALGVFTSFERFIQGYQPESDKISIFASLCQSVGSNADQYSREAENLINSVKGLSVEDLVSKISTSAADYGTDAYAVGVLKAIAQNPNFKYSRLFAIGLYTLLAEASPEVIKNEEKRNQALKQLSEALHLPPEKLQKDFDFYRSNLDKMDQLIAVLEESLQAERKKREQREQEKSVTPSSQGENPQ